MERLRKIDLMHKYFGKAESGICKDCEHYIRFYYHDKPYRKCDVYGNTNSEATDWKQSYLACGLYPDEAYSGKDIVRMVTGGKIRTEEQIEGQLSIEDFINDKIST